MQWQQFPKTRLGWAGGSGFARCRPEQAESFAGRKGSRRRTHAFPGDSSAKPERPVSQFGWMRWLPCDASGDGANEECRGPSLAFVPLRGTKDCPQMANLRVRGAPSAILAPLILEIGLDPLLDAHAALVLDVEANAESLV